MAIVVDRDVAFFKQQINLLYAVAAAVLAGAAGIHDGRVAVDEHRVVGFQILGRDILK